MKLKLKVQQDYLEKNLNKKSPVLAVSELIWNALDADADRVELTFKKNPLDELEEIQVTDDGHGISLDKARSTFENLGNSWKKTALISTKGRQLHGRGGEGRLSAFALGRFVKWESKCIEDGKIHSISIVGNLDSSNEFEFDVNEVQSKKNEKIGTQITLSNLNSGAGMLLTQTGKHKLAEIFALYLKLYSVKILIDNTLVDPKDLEVETKVINLKDFKLPSGKKTDFNISIVEWKQRVDRVIHLCDLNGFPLSNQPINIQAPGFNFTIYISSSLINDMYKNGTLEIANLDPDFEAIISKVKIEAKDYFRARLAEKTKNIVETWKEEKVYPYSKEPQTPMEKVERQVFDVVALQVHEYLPEFATSDSTSKKFNFQMLKTVIEGSPREAQKIIQEVLQLPKEKQEELAELLERTQLSAIINAAKLVSNRLEFLKGLEALIYTQDLKDKTKERKHLHRIIAENTWVFGEQYNLTVSRFFVNQTFDATI